LGGTKFKFGHLILSKIIKTVATRCHILRLKCTKFDFGWGSTPDPTRGAQNAPPDLLAGFKGVLLLTEGYREGMERGDKRGRIQKNGGGGERVRHGFVGWTPLGLGFQIKSPKFFGRFATNRGQVCGGEG